ncbi:VOC family protein [Rugamonas apoptosis]|uniref:VOC family protein n=1 Tax=Rugamonas apoptosis TaxID=2758570 RepID=A0A7W2FDV3_9BURK|nr:VOC family protein [Rugamonas apoptosis]MBA5689917.1 VOC family protein [Rugamonas apoptosis]
MECKLQEMGEAQVMAAARDSVFNRVRMGYAVIESRKTDAWRLLLGEALGMQAEIQSDQSLSARMDDHVRRLIVVPGPSEDLQALGMELADEQALAVVLKRLAKRGIDVKESTTAAAQQRGVHRFWHFTGPKGLTIELYHQPRLVGAPPRMATSGFITGDKGFGHVAMSTRRPDQMKQFWREIFDIRHTDDVHYTISGVPMLFEFMRFNPRHHSIAFVYTPKIRLDPIRTRIQHLEVQAATLDDLGAAWERCRALGLTIAMSVGQHANDKAISFYVATPSGFDIEFGWNPLEVDEASWDPAVWTRISTWGHHFEGQTLAGRLGQLGRGVASLLRKEYVPAGF